MKKLLTAKSLSLLMLLSLFGGKAEAGRNYEDGYVSESRDCCFSSCYDCGCNPLYCGAWDLQIQGGVEPVTWRNRGPISGFGCVTVDDVTTPTIFTIFDTNPNFSKLFKTPWTVGGQIGYHWSDNARVYVEFDYMQTKGKDSVLTEGIGTLTSVNFNFNKYKLFEAYVGARYYWDRWCDRVAFFLGGKVGLTHHKRVTSSNFVVVPTITALGDDFVLYNGNTIVSGGADFGFDVCFCGNWSFVVTGAVIASCGPRNIAPFAIDNDTDVSFLSLGSVGTELRFPVTAGIRYSF